MSKDIKREKNFFGDGYTYYDEKGKKIGTSEKNFFSDSYTNYDAKGKKVGKSERNFFGDGYTNYDAKGKKIGTSKKNFFSASYTNYDKNGKKINKTHNSIWDYDEDEDFDMSEDGSNGACYIATAVYGSYDCPEVWILRRYRDFYLSKRFWGRAFIKFYYKVSPSVVRLFGKNKFFNGFFLWLLNGKIRKLKEVGYDDGEYED